MTLDEVKAALAKATREGREELVDGNGEIWLKQRSGWAKQYAWMHDQHRSFTFAELGIGSA